jgi:hypothetical protein
LTGRKSQIPTRKFQGNSNKPSPNFQCKSGTPLWNLVVDLLEFPWNFWVGIWNFRAAAIWNFRAVAGWNLEFPRSGVSD